MLFHGGRIPSDSMVKDCFYVFFCWIDNYLVRFSRSLL